MSSTPDEETPTTHVGPWRVVLVDDHGISGAGVRHDSHFADQVEVVGEGET